MHARAYATIQRDLQEIQELVEPGHWRHVPVPILINFYELLIGIYHKNLSCLLNVPQQL